MNQRPTPRELLDYMAQRFPALLMPVLEQWHNEQEDAADLAAVAASKAEGVFVPLDQALAEVDQPLAAGDWEGDSVKLQLEYEFLPSGDMVIVDRLHPPTPPAPAEQNDVH